jgi:hypothetical protein
MVSKWLRFAPFLALVLSFGCRKAVRLDGPGGLSRGRPAEAENTTYPPARSSKPPSLSPVTSSCLCEVSQSQQSSKPRMTPSLTLCCSNSAQKASTLNDKVRVPTVQMPFSRTVSKDWGLAFFLCRVSWSSRPPKSRSRLWPLILSERHRPLLLDAWLSNRLLIACFCRMPGPNENVSRHRAPHLPNLLTPQSVHGLLAFENLTDQRNSLHQSLRLVYGCLRDDLSLPLDSTGRCDALSPESRNQYGHQAAALQANYDQLARQIRNYQNQNGGAEHVNSQLVLLRENLDAASIQGPATAPTGADNQSTGADQAFPVEASSTQSHASFEQLCEVLKVDMGEFLVVPMKLKCECGSDTHSSSHRPITGVQKPDREGKSGNPRVYQCDDSYA